MSRQLLTEFTDSSKNPLSFLGEENEGRGKFVYLKGLCLEGDVRNHNGRVYPRQEIETAVASLNERIKKYGPLPGELDHPTGLNINFDRISHLITEMTMDGSNGLGKMKVINGGLGLTVRSVIEAGMKVGVSSRGTGDVDGQGQVRDFDIVTIDIVANPSAPNAFPGVSLSEAMNRRTGQEVMKLTEWARHDDAAQKYLAQEINSLLKDIANNLGRK